ADVVNRAEEPRRVAKRYGVQRDAACGDRLALRRAFRAFPADDEIGLEGEDALEVGIDCPADGCYVGDLFGLVVARATDELTLGSHRDDEIGRARYERNDPVRRTRQTNRVAVGIDENDCWTRLRPATRAGESGEENKENGMASHGPGSLPRGCCCRER